MVGLGFDSLASIGSRRRVGPRFGARIYEARPDGANVRGPSFDPRVRPPPIRPGILSGMQRRTVSRRRTAFSITVAIVVSVAACVAFAAGAAPETDSAANSTESWKGRFCTQPGCTESDESAPWGQAAGFGVAVVVTGVLARRND
jgi:hypothetical protein